MEYILKCLPTQLAKLILEHNIQKLEEIRIRANKPVILKLGQVEIVLSYTITTNEIIGILQNICNNSIYTYQNQICNGFITLPGGNRVGIAGNVVIKDGQVSNISYIYSLNFRISHQINGASDNILKYVLDTENNTIFNTLIVSPPGAGKTTMIRDLAKRISNGINEINFRGLDVSIIDESMRYNIAENRIRRCFESVDDGNQFFAARKRGTSLNGGNIVCCQTKTLGKLFLCQT